MDNCITYTFRRLGVSTCSEDHERPDCSEPRYLINSDWRCFLKVCPRTQTVQLDNADPFSPPVVSSQGLGLCSPRHSKGEFSSEQPTNNR